MALKDVDNPEVPRAALARGRHSHTLLRTWTHFHNMWFKGAFLVFLLVVDSIEVVGCFRRPSGQQLPISSSLRIRTKSSASCGATFLARSFKRTLRFVLRVRGTSKQAATWDVHGLAMVVFPFGLPLVSTQR